MNDALLLILVLGVIVLAAGVDLAVAFGWLRRQWR
jgi:hypothetical protein